MKTDPAQGAPRRPEPGQILSVCFEVPVIIATFAPMNRLRFLYIALALTLLSAAAATEASPEKEWPQTHFAWGADVSSTIDMTGQDMSTFNLSAALGYKNRAVQLAGVGAAMEIGVSNSARMFPVYAIVRTPFTTKPSRCFMEVKAGWSFNQMTDNASQSGLYGSAGIGINLAMGRNFRSHILMAYTYRQLTDGYKDMHAVTAGIGINF